MIDQLGGRKFIGFLLVAAMFFVLVLVRVLPIDQFVAFITANFGIYVVGNVSSSVVGQNNAPIVITPTVTPVGPGVTG